jgi:hypothetical protein
MNKNAAYLKGLGPLGSIECVIPALSTVRAACTDGAAVYVHSLEESLPE